jgi:hypothetical protein
LTDGDSELLRSEKKKNILTFLLPGVQSLPEPFRACHIVAALAVKSKKMERLVQSERFGGGKRAPTEPTGSSPALATILSDKSVVRKPVSKLLKKVSHCLVEKMRAMHVLRVKHEFRQIHELCLCRCIPLMMQAPLALQPKDDVGAILRPQKRIRVDSPRRRIVVI